ncbi:MAG: SpoIID/LytB domain-containing protein, partial [Planctomycetota bacterium]
MSSSEEGPTPMRLVLRALLVTAAVVAAAHLTSCRFRPSPAERDLAVYPDAIDGVPAIRVLVQDGLAEARVTVDGPYVIEAVPPDPAQHPLGEAAGPVAATVRPTVQGFVLGDPKSPRAHAPYPRIRFRPKPGAHLTVDGIDYGGAVDLVRVLPAGNEGAPRLRVVALVDLERYLVGVVPHEMYSHWPVEALRAQCIASRSYALYKIKTRAHVDFDVRDSAASQVWKPSGKGSPIINAVVNSTRGIVMTDNWRLFPAYFSAQCGGETKNGADVFVSREISPLSGVKCPFCFDSPRELHRWRVSIPLTEVRERLARRGTTVGEVRAVRALDNHGRALKGVGRVYDVSVEHDGAGRMLILPAETFRYIMGPGRNRVASSFLTAETQSGSVVLQGRGHGHGVGMCQYG